MSDLEELRGEVERFLDARDWHRFHTPKNVSMALTVEAGELMELFQWHDNLPTAEVQEDEELMARVREELADVLIYALSMAIQLDIDPADAVREKIDANRERYDVETARAWNAEMDAWKRDRPEEP